MKNFKKHIYHYFNKYDFKMKKKIGGKKYFINVSTVSTMKIHCLKEKKRVLLLMAHSSMRTFSHGSLGYQNMFAPSGYSGIPGGYNQGVFPMPSGSQDMQTNYRESAPLIPQRTIEFTCIFTKKDNNGLTSIRAF